MDFRQTRPEYENGLHLRRLESCPSFIEDDGGIFTFSRVSRRKIAARSPQCRLGTLAYGESDETVDATARQVSYVTGRGLAVNPDKVAPKQ